VLGGGCGAATGLEIEGPPDAADARPADAGRDGGGRDAGLDAGRCRIALRHAGISSGPDTLGPGLFCDQLALCAPDFAAQSTLDLASPRMTCADATLPECGGPGCYYGIDLHAVAAEDMALLCSLRDAITHAVCTVYGP